MNPRLKVEVGKQVGIEYEIPPRSVKNRIVLGRGAGCDLRFADIQLSREHCAFSYDGHQVFVEDLNSRNGTKVNGLRIKGKKRLRNHDHVSVGSYRLLVIHKAASADKKVRLPSLMTDEEKWAEEIAHLEGKQFAGIEAEKELHHGRFCSIFRVRDPNLGRVMAMKLIRPDSGAGVEMRERFLRGAKCAAQLRHPNFVKVIKADRERGVLYVLMEHTEGEPIDSFMEKRNEPLETKLVLELARQLLQALAAAYELKLVFRTIQPHGVMVTPDLKAKIVDFELVKPLPGENRRRISRLVDSSVRVDNRFSSPEMIVRPMQADQRTDLFGVGAIMFYMLTCSRPFLETLPDDPVVQVFFRKVENPSRRNPDIPGDVAEIVVKALAQQPDERYQTPQEMLAAVEKAQSSL